jgi:Ser/Thr protein kinase RdoA (MazF antagonist)
MRQEYSQTYLQNVIDAYHDLGCVKTFFLYKSGYENSNYYIESEAGKYVIKIFEGIGVQSTNVEFELSVMDFCFHNKLKTPHVLINQQGGLSTFVGGKYSMVMDFIEGENMSEKELSDDLVIEAAGVAGRMDFLLKNFKDGSQTRQNYEWDLKNTLKLESTMRFLPSSFNKEIFANIFDDFKKIKNDFCRLPTGLIHNDIVPHNWLVYQGRLNGLIDFSDLAFSPYIQNVAVSLHLIAFCYNWNPRQARLFIDHYMKFNTLSKTELNLLYVLIKARFLSFVLEFNRWNEEYGFDEHRQQTVVDHYAFLQRFSEFGETEFNHAVGAD